MPFTRIAVTVVAILVLATAASADHLLRQEVRSEAMEMMGMEIPPNVDTLEMWISTEKAAVRVPGENMTIILSLSGGDVTIVNHSNKSYVNPDIDLNAVLESTGKELDSLMKEERPDDPQNDSTMKQVAEMFKGLTEGIKITVEATGESKKVGDWNAEKYMVTTDLGMLVSVSEVWATEDIDVNPDLYNMCDLHTMVALPGFENVCKEMKKVKGITVESKSETEMMGNKLNTFSRIIEYKETAAPKGIYDVPEGYTEMSSIDETYKTVD